MTTKTPSYEKVTIKKLDRSRVEITGSVAVAVWEKYRSEALKNINNAVSIDGFRKGMVPENILIGKVGEMGILEEIAELALSKAYVEILINEKIDAIGKPEIRVTKLAKDNPLEFVAITSVVPTVTLPDYKKLAAEQVKKADPEDLKVEEKDIEEAILKIRKRHAADILHSDEHADSHDHSKMTPEEHDKAVEAAMPELTDSLVKTLGDFNDVPDFKNKLSDMIAEQKRDEAREKLRLHIADALAEHATVELPDVMIESELERTEAQFSADIERMGVKLGDYMKHAKKTIEELRAEWRPHAEKKAKLQLILNEISIKENIKPDKKEIEEEVNHIVEHYKDADRERATTYAETVLTNEKVFQFLEKAK
jgi:FKBP-type peptidyl-prolyl cis-trans isomerase (trigger factor)